MTDIKPIIAKNITALRQSQKMTQIDLAEKLNYSDKAVSKWERGESIPDVSVLKNIADLFGVTVDYLLEEDHTPVPKAEPEKPVKNIRNRAVVTTLSVLLVWLVATLCYVLMDMILPQVKVNWLPFLYAVPISFIVWLVLNSVFFNTRRNYLIISLLMWTALASVVITLWAFGILSWKMLLLGIPGQVIILVWSRFQRKNG